MAGPLPFDGRSRVAGGLTIAGRRWPATGHGLEVDRPDLPRSTGFGADDGRWDDAPDAQPIDRRELPRIETRPDDPNGVADLQPGTTRAG